MSNLRQTGEPDAVTKAQFDRDCALIYIDFQNAQAPNCRRCVRRITAWKKVYFVEFYWGSPIFLSKQEYRSSDSSLGADIGLQREFAAPYRLQKNASKKTKLRHRADPRWDKGTHQQWLEERELEVRLFWARKKYLDLGETEDSAYVKASYELLGVEPFSTIEVVRRAYHQEAKKFHPDRGGDTKNFLLLQRAYKAALENSSENDQSLLVRQSV